MIAERVPAEPLSEHPALKSGQKSSNVSYPTRQQGATDRAREHRPPPASLPRNHTLVTNLAVCHPGACELSLLDVALVLAAVSSHCDSYILASANCWWFSRTVGFTLEMLAAMPPPLAVPVGKDDGEDDGKDENTISHEATKGFVNRSLQPMATLAGSKELCEDGVAV